MNIRSTDPRLAIPAPDPIGRLYRLHGSDPLPVNSSGGVNVPSRARLAKGVREGEFVPSVTNVIDALGKPYLVTWGAKVALERALEVERSHPGYMLQKPKQAVAYLKKENERIRDAAAEQGTRVHEACEYLARGMALSDLPGEPLNEREMLYVDSWKRWADVWQPEFVALEATFFGETSRGLGYAGTADFVAHINGLLVIGDIKTTNSGLHNEVALQLTALSRSRQYVTDDDELAPTPKFDAAIALHVSPDLFHVKEASMSDETWGVFEGLRHAWDFKAFEGALRSDDPALKPPRDTFPRSRG